MPFNRLSAPRIGEFAGASGDVRAEDLEYIARLRARGVSLQGVSKMTGFGIDAVRRITDLVEFRPIDPPANEPAPVARDVIWISPAPSAGRKIASEVAHRYGLTFAELEGPARSRAIAHPRQHAMWELRQLTTLSLPQIGRLLGGRDHSTVHHGINAHEQRMAKRRAAA